MRQEKANFIQAWTDSLSNGSFVKMTLGKPATDLTDIKKIVVSPVIVNEKPSMRVVMSRATNDITKNLTSGEAIVEASGHIGRTFFSATLFTTVADYSLIYNKRGEARLAKSKATKSGPASIAHNREKTTPLTRDVHT